MSSEKIWLQKSVISLYKHQKDGGLELKKILVYLWILNTNIINKLGFLDHLNKVFMRL